MSGRGRKPANRSGGRKPQPAPKRNAASGTRSGGTGSTATRQRPAASGRSTASGRPARAETYPFKDSLQRRKRRQKLIVWIGVGAIIAAAVATIILGQIGGKQTPSNAASSTTSATAKSSAAASSSPTPSPSPTTTAAPAGPALAMTCPTGGGASPVFGHDVTGAAEPYSITITYGDGDKYTDTSAHLGAIFSHTYKKKGTYTVTANLTDAAKATTTASCTYTW